MGKVFSPSAIAAGEYPKPGDHEAAALALTTEFEAENQETGFAGMILGSVASHFSGIRSDLDVLGVIPDDADVSRVQGRVADRIAGVAARWKIPIEAHLMTAGDLAERRPRVMRDLLFIEHLAQVASDGEYVVGELATHLKPLIEYDSAHEQWQAAKRTAENYGLFKAAYFLIGSLASFGKPDYYRLQRAFELPSALGRKLLRLNELTEWANSHDDPDPSYPARGFYARESLAKGVRRLLAGTRYEPCAAWLVDHDAEYTKLLQSTMQGDTSIADYEAWLEGVHRPAMRRALALSIGAFLLVRRQPAPDRNVHSRSLAVNPES
jgi:hypothetical protein